MYIKDVNLDMRYKYTIFREHNLPGLKPNVIDKLLLYKVPQSVVGSILEVSYV